MESFSALHDRLGGFVAKGAHCFLTVYGQKNLQYPICRCLHTIMDGMVRWGVICSSGLIRDATKKAYLWHVIQEY